MRLNKIYKMLLRIKGVKTMRMIILAAPGAGKGTQAEILSKHFGIPTVSTGAILRKNIQEGTKLGDLAKKYIDDGKFVPDDVMIDIVKNRLGEGDCANGFILDGFPRNIEQAHALKNAGIPVDCVLTLEVEDEDIVKRISGRLECEKCGTTFHKQFRIPKQEGICDKCGGNLKTRKDDKPETVKERLKTYHEKTEPLKKFYEEEGLLVTAHGKEGIEATSKEVLAALEK